MLLWTCAVSGVVQLTRAVGLSLTLPFQSTALSARSYDTTSGHVPVSLQGVSNTAYPSVKCYSWFQFLWHVYFVYSEWNLHEVSIQLLDSGIFSFVKLHPQEVLADNDKSMVTEYQCWNGTEINSSHCPCPMTWLISFLCLHIAIMAKEKIVANAMATNYGRTHERSVALAKVTFFVEEVHLVLHRDLNQQGEWEKGIRINFCSVGKFNTYPVVSMCLLKAIRFKNSHSRSSSISVSDERNCNQNSKASQNKIRCFCGIPYVHWSLFPGVPVKAYQQWPLRDCNWMPNIRSIYGIIFRWNVFFNSMTVATWLSILQQSESGLLPQ